MPEAAAMWACVSAILASAAVLISTSLHGCNPFGLFGNRCSASGVDCTSTKCCADAGLGCYQKDLYWASCKASCTPGIDPTDPGEYQSPWSCIALSPPATPARPAMSDMWTTGTWTTGYWDCCKPSCGWEGKGSFNQPVASCDARTGFKLGTFNAESVCAGGIAATCADNAPFVVNAGLSMGFAAVNAQSEQAMCGQCFELRFTNEKHDNGAWGGASMGLVGKAMVLQVTNIGADVTGQHSFDIQIPGAGQGKFYDGCTRQFGGYQSDDFDCGNRFGGCEDKSGCNRLPPELRAGCDWRFDWYGWLTAGDTTNNPYVVYRRVRCPMQLVAISGSTPLDDASQPAIDEQQYQGGKAPEFVTV